MTMTTSLSKHPLYSDLAETVKQTGLPIWQLYDCEDFSAEQTFIQNVNSCRPNFYNHNLPLGASIRTGTDTEVILKSQITCGPVLMILINPLNMKRVCFI
jgi:hypothetical protein